MTTNPNPGWIRFVVHGLIGAFLGACVGAALWAFIFIDTPYGVWVLIGMAILCGLLAAVLGDRFWHSFQEGSLLNPLNWW
jgi:hypothetical protein